MDKVHSGTEEAEYAKWRLEEETRKKHETRKEYEGMRFNVFFFF